MSDLEFSEKIIIEVEKRPLIWDVTHKDHHNRAAISNAWWAIAKELDVSEKLCQTRWRSLRDCYVRAVNSVVKKTGSAASSSKQKSFAFVEEMSFLRSTIAAPKTDSNLSKESITDSPQVLSSEEEADLNLFDSEIKVCEKFTDPNFQSLSPNVSTASISSDLPRSSVDSKQQTKPSTKKKRVLSNKDEFSVISQAFMNKINSIGSNNEDELTIFGRYVACELRKLNLKNQYVLKHKIDQLIFETHMAELNEASAVLSIQLIVITIIYKL